MGIRGAEIDLSRHDGTSSYGEITVLAEIACGSPGPFGVGTDDGNLQVSRDGGHSWTEGSRNVPGVGDGTYVSRIVASRSGSGIAYVTFDAHRDGGLRAVRFPDHRFRRGHGHLWQQGLPSGSINAMAEHPDNPNLLFVGTEHSVFVSTSAGTDWAKLSHLPTTPVDDLILHPREKDLVIGTHGQSIWILDDTRATGRVDRRGCLSLGARLQHPESDDLQLPEGHLLSRPSRISWYEPGGRRPHHVHVGTGGRARQPFESRTPQGVSCSNSSFRPKQAFIA